MQALDNNLQPDQALSTLSGMLQRFSASSAKLEERYEILRKEAESLRVELRKKDQEIKGARKLAVLGEAAARLAHEIRNPLGAMTLFISMLKQDLEGNDSALNLINEMSKSITSLNAVVSNTLHFAKERDTVMTPVNLHSVISEVASHFVTLIKEEGHLHLDLGANPFVRGDSGELRQVFYNLLTNAAQATSYRGELAIQSRDVREGVVIVVRDNGKGINPEMLDQIFEPFSTDKQGGTGLGLAIVNNIIGKHGGNISARNENGAVFEITLPRSKKSERGSEVGEAK